MMVDGKNSDLVSHKTKTKHCYSYLFVRPTINEDYTYKKQYCIRFCFGEPLFKNLTLFVTSEEHLRNTKQTM